MEPSFEVMHKHNLKVSDTLKELLKIGNTSFNKCFDVAVAKIQDGSLTAKNQYDKCNHVLSDEYFQFLKTNNIVFYDLQGSDWEFFFTCLSLSVKLELIKPVVRDSSNLAQYVIWCRDLSY